jgi:cytochrome c
MTHGSFRLLIASIVLVAALPARAADIAAGRKAFAKCRICHTIAAGAPSTVGPDLHRVFGRKAGTFDDFGYSPAMKSSGVTWDDDTLAKYLRDPKTFIPGNRMAFPGISSEAEIENLLAYLKQATR